MEKKYILSADQSTQGTKALLFDSDGELIHRCDMPHEQMIDEKGWVSHDPEEIYKNTVQVLKNVIEESGISQNKIAGLGISNQRETSLIWERDSGKAAAHAIVWQCTRGKEICARIEQEGVGEQIKKRTGIPLSPYYPAAKIAWLLENTEGALDKARSGRLCYGTIDSWLVYRLTGGRSYKTDYSNASRTQIFNLEKLEWDEDVCTWFGIPLEYLAEVCDSNSDFGETDLEGFLDKPIPIRGVMGDSHGALFGQGCLEKGMIKTTYGTGSSIMMNIGEKPVFSDKGIVTSLAWGMDGEVSYVLEGNIIYTGAVISWLEKDLGLVESAKETSDLAKKANPADVTYFVPAFTGLGAPYWNSQAKGIVCGITRMTGKAELVKASLECIAYQITDIINVMNEESGIEIQELRVDGGPTKNDYLMQFQSDMTRLPVMIPNAEELSGIGAAYAAGLALGVFEKEKVFGKIKRTKFTPSMDSKIKKLKYNGWKDAVNMVLTY